MHEKVLMTFVDDVTGNPFAQTEVPVDQLPENFAQATRLRLGDSDWQVIAAHPPSRDECAQTGQLMLRIRKIEAVDPSVILYSLPSICSRIPNVQEGKVSPESCLISEDEWRQLEFVSVSRAIDTEQQLALIRKIHEEQWAQSGWKKLHVREQPDPAIISELKLADLDGAFEGIEFEGLGYHQNASPIKDGFSFRTRDGLQFYGIVEEDRVNTLGIMLAPSELAVSSSIDVMQKIAKEFDLELVHWCRCARAQPGDDLFRQMMLDASD